MFSIKAKSIKEQIDIEELKPEKEGITRIKKRLTYAEEQEKQYQKRVKELEAELNEILTPVEVSYIGKGFEAIFADISNLLEKKTDRTEVQVKTELKLYGIWYRHKLATDMKQIIEEDMKRIVKEQKSKLKSIEETFETDKNGSEIDELLPIIKGELPSLANRLQALGENLLDVEKYSVIERVTNKVTGRTATVNIYRDQRGKFFSYTDENGVERALYYQGGASAWRGAGWAAMPKRHDKVVE